MKLHHIGYLTGDIAATRALYAEFLGYEVCGEPIEDVPQTAVVQFLRQPGADHYVELVCPNSPESKLSNALEKGANLHHLCYEVEDINASSEALRQSKAYMMISKVGPGAAFNGAQIVWFMGKDKQLVELVEADRDAFLL